LLAAKKKAVIVSFRQDTEILTAGRTAGSAAVCKVIFIADQNDRGPWGRE